MEGLALPSGARRGPNCGVTAVAIAAGVSFDHAWSLFARDRRGNWKGSTTHVQRVRVLRLLGCAVTDIPAPRGVTLLTWVKRFAAPGVSYMVRTTGHVQTVRDGFVIDQTTPEPVHHSAFWLRLKRVKTVSIVTKGA